MKYPHASQFSLELSTQACYNKEKCTPIQGSGSSSPTILVAEVAIAAGSISGAEPQMLSLMVIRSQTELSLAATVAMAAVQSGGADVYCLRASLTTARAYQSLLANNCREKRTRVNSTYTDSASL